MKKSFLDIMRLAVVILIIFNIFAMSGCADNDSGMSGKIEYYYDASEVDDSDLNSPKTESSSSETSEKHVDTTAPEIEPTPADETSAPITTALAEITTEAVTVSDPETTEIPETADLPETEIDTEIQTETEAVSADTEAQVGTEYLLNTNTKKFHYISCKSGQKTKAENRELYIGERDDIISRGYSPCKNCNP